MLKPANKILIALFLLVGYLHTVHAQDECEVVLLRATDEFNAGHFYSIPSLLKECLDKGQNREWRQRAYLLLAETYLLLDDPVGAEKSYLEVLHANPEFVPDASRDPIDLVYLSSKFTSTPIFTLFGKIGLNTSVVRPILYRNLYTQNEKYKLRGGFHLGGGVDWNYNDNLSVSVEGNYVLTAYKYEGSQIFGNDNLVLIDRQNWVIFPLSVKYSDNKGKYRPYGYAGLSLDLLLSDKATIAYDDRNVKPNTNPEEIQNEQKESPLFSFNPKRNTFNRSVFVGGGVKYKLGLRYAFLDVRYSFGLTNIVNPENSIYNYKKQDDLSNSAEPAFSWAYIDNLFRMDNLYVSVGYSHPLYNPRKLKTARSKSVFRKIKKQGNEGVQK